MQVNSVKPDKPKRDKPKFTRSQVGKMLEREVLIASDCGNLFRIVPLADSTEKFHVEYRTQSSKYPWALIGVEYSREIAARIQTAAAVYPIAEPNSD